MSTAAGGERTIDAEREKKIRYFGLKSYARGSNLKYHLNIQPGPERCKSLIPEKISNVNLFKLIFACIEGKEPNFVEDKFFYANQDLKRLGKETYIDDKLKEWTQLKDYQFLFN